MNNQETINSVLIDILKGAKEAGHEIYGASKEGIIKAVDFAQTQAPLVVEEFLRWQFAKAAIEFGVCAFVLSVAGYIVCRLWKKTRSEDYEFDWVMPVSVVSVFYIVLTCVYGNLVGIPALETMVQIKVAPRIYVIEWAADQINSPKNHN